MNYSRIYEQLVQRAKNRVPEGYVERHHIIPKCMGGSDENDNLVALTPEEHFTAHVLLVKMYPNQTGLILAVNKMCRGKGRSRNKMYGWLKRRFAEEQRRRQTGQGNTQFGTMWICNVETKQNKKVPKDSGIEDGWIKGRSLWLRNVCTCGKPDSYHSPRCRECLDSAKLARLSRKENHKPKPKRGKKPSRPKIRNYERQVICDRVVFGSLTSAARHFKVSVETVRNRIKNVKHNWKDMPSGLGT